MPILREPSKVEQILESRAAGIDRETMALTLSHWPASLKYGQFQDLSENKNTDSRTDWISQLIMKMTILLSPAQKQPQCS